MLSCNNVSFSHDRQEILHQVSFTLAKGERIGLIGPNGAGKTTLLKILSGLIIPNEGGVFCDGKIAYLPQEFTDEELVLTPRQMVGRIRLDGSALETDERLYTWCGQIDLDRALLNQPIGQLSGGERNKVALLKILFSEADILLLDEPTNNLDLAGLEFLDNFVKASKTSFLIVSHDRRFLDNSITKIIEISEESRAIKIYSGNYTYYQAQKEKEADLAWEKYQDYRDQVKKLEGSACEKKQWAAKGRKDPNLPDSDKFIKRKALDRLSKHERSAKNLERRLDTLKENEITKPKQKIDMHFTFDPKWRSGDKVFTLKQTIKVMPRGILGPIDLSIAFGDRIAIMGSNGVGKTTLLNLLSRKIEVDLGEILTGANVRLGYLEQTPFQNAGQSILETILDHESDQTEARKILHKFGLGEGDLNKKISDLSPGERSRLILASLVAQKPNCLLLDEPSNHLDLEAITALEQTIKEFKGTVIAVSHDRYFLDRIKPAKKYLLESKSEETKITEASLQ